MGRAELSRAVQSRVLILLLIAAEITTATPA
jgi:hypothetical protein